MLEEFMNVQKGFMVSLSSEVTVFVSLYLKHTATSLADQLAAL